MSNVKVVLSATKIEAFAPGTALAGYEFSINGLPSQVISAEPLEALFIGVPEGDNVANVQAVDINGVLLGSPISVAFNVPPVIVIQPDALLAVPAEIQVVVVTVDPSPAA